MERFAERAVDQILFEGNRNSLRLLKIRDGSEDLGRQLQVKKDSQGFVRHRRSRLSCYVASAPSEVVPSVQTTIFQYTSNYCTSPISRRVKEGKLGDLLPLPSQLLILSDHIS